MRVTVLYFGMLRDVFGVRDEVVELAKGAAVEDLLRILDGRTSNFRMEARLWQSVAVAVNREYATPVVVLHEGDEVALLPPVSGGSFAEGGKRASLARACCPEGDLALPLVAAQGCAKESGE